MTETKRLADAIAWLERQQYTGHCGEENSEIKARDRHNDRIDLILTTLREAEGMRGQATFLLERLRDLEASDSDGFERDYYGHVSPAATRLRQALQGGGE